MEKNIMQCTERGLRCLTPAHFARTSNYSNGITNPFLWAEQSLLHRSSRSNSFGRFSIPACCTPPFLGRSTESAVFSWRIRVLTRRKRENRGIEAISGVPSLREIASLQRVSEKRTCRVAIGTEVQKESLEPSIK